MMETWTVLFFVKGRTEDLKTEVKEKRRKGLRIL